MISNKSKILTIVCWLTIFSIAMAFLENAIVIYLRELYYPGGFDFPLAPMEPDIALTEIIREAATMIILICVGIIAGRNFSEKFAYFIYCFAIWDIFYYVFLKLLLNWPDSFMTWDLLFLIPVTWAGPVITPIILSLTMILLAVLVVFFNEKTGNVRISQIEWLILIFGSLVVILSFTWDYSKFILQHYSIIEIFSASSREGLFDLAFQYIPRSFNWWLYGLGELIILFGIGVFYFRNKNKK